MREHEDSNLGETIAFRVDAETLRKIDAELERERRRDPNVRKRSHVLRVLLARALAECP